MAAELSLIAVSSSYFFGQMLDLVDFDSGIDFVDEVKGSVESNCSSKQPKGYDHHKRVRKVKQGRPIKKKKKILFFCVRQLESQ